MTKTNRTHKLISRLAVAMISAALLGSAVAPAGIAAGRDDKCRTIQNKKKRQRCLAKHEGANHLGVNHQ